MATPSDTVINFFKLVKTGGSQDIPSIKALFVPDAAPPGPPNIGLTTGGPTFTTQAGIGDMFTTLKKSLPQYGLDPKPNPNNPQLLIGGNQISVEAILTAGTWKHSWDPPNPPGKSRPLSHVMGTDEGGSGGAQTQLPVCAVFTLHSVSPYLIINLALYFDRWKLANDKWDKTHPQHVDK
jgi:hypothetical protein